jgi:hypothetical protein
LSLLLKTSPLISELALYDVVNTPGVAADLSHISSPAVCTQERKGGRHMADEAYRKSLAIYPRMTELSSPSRMQTSLSSLLEFPVRPDTLEISTKIEADTNQYRKARNDPR